MDEASSAVAAAMVERIWERGGHERVVALLPKKQHLAPATLPPTWMHGVAATTITARKKVRLDPDARNCELSPGFAHTQVSPPFPFPEQLLAVLAAIKPMKGQLYCANVTCEQNAQNPFKRLRVGVSW